MQNHRLATGTILQTIPAKDRPEFATHVVVSTKRGRYRAVLGPGLYKLVRVEDLPKGDEVCLVLHPVPTMMGRIDSE
jgi:hypothetical protein